MRLHQIMVHLLFITCGLACASTVQLDDGRVFNAEVVDQDNAFYLFRINGRLAQIPRDRVVNISDQQPRATKEVAPGVAVFNSTSAGMIIRGEAALPPEQPQQPAEPFSEPAIPVTVGTPPVARMPLPDDPDRLQTLRNAVNSLRSQFPDQRINAEQTVAGAGEAGLAALAVYGLYNASPDIRTRSVQLLGTLAGRTALKQMIEAFYAAARPTIPPYQVEFVGALADQISALTGQDFRFQARSGSMAPIVAQRMIQWWRLNYDQLPPQLGEPTIPLTDPNYAASINQLRQLNLEEREFGGSNYPPGLVGPILPPTPAEQEFLSTVARLPRSAAFRRDIPASGEEGTEENGLNPTANRWGELRALDWEQRARGTQD
ncbi:MAG TPA: hypothetical protein VEK08_23400 [Planctomycetota bacterium]|nr:hypothetical protein [Planctomycetota bacterium]